MFTLMWFEVEVQDHQLIPLLQPQAGLRVPIRLRLHFNVRSHLKKSLFETLDSFFQQKNWELRVALWSKPSLMRQPLSMNCMVSERPIPSHGSENKKHPFLSARLQWQGCVCGVRNITYCYSRIGTTSANRKRNAGDAHFAYLFAGDELILNFWYRPVV